MTDIEQVEQKSTALATVEQAEREVVAALQHYAQALGVITPEKAAQTHGFFKQMSDLFEERKAQVRDMLLLHLSVHGMKFSDKGSVGAVVGGQSVKAIITRTGFDSKKVVPLLTKRGIQLADGCNATIEYKVDADKIEALRKAGRLTDEDLVAIRYDKSYRLEVRPIGEE